MFSSQADVISHRCSTHHASTYHGRVVDADRKFGPFKRQISIKDIFQEVDQTSEIHNDIEASQTPWRILLRCGGEHDLHLLKSNNVEGFMKSGRKLRFESSTIC